MSSQAGAQHLRQRALVDEREPLGGAGEGDVERPGALHLLLEDGGGLDHDGGVELEALHEAHRHDGDLAVEAVARGPAELDALLLEAPRRPSSTSESGTITATLPGSTASRSTSACSTTAAAIAAGGRLDEARLLALLAHRGRAA